MGKEQPYNREHKRVFEMSEGASEVIALFQKAKQAEDHDKKVKLMQSFYSRLMQLITPKDEAHFNLSDQVLIDILNGKKMDNYLSVGGGTSGQRIYFENHIIIPSGEDPHKYGFDLESTQFGGFYELESKDRKPRWMLYRKPEGKDWSYGQRYFECFIKEFGDTIVDLNKS